MRMWDVFMLVDTLLPTGGFALSHGLETQVQNGQVTTTRDLERSLWTYARQVMASEIPIYRRLRNTSDPEKELRATQLVLDAWVMPQEVRQANLWQAQRLVKIVESTFAVSIDPGPLYQIQAWAIVTRYLSIDEEHGVEAYLYKQLAEITSAAMRLMRCDSVQIVAALWRLREKLAAHHMNSDQSPREIASISPWLDIAQMQHENQSSRLFRT